VRGRLVARQISIREAEYKKLVRIRYGGRIGGLQQEIVVVGHPQRVQPRVVSEPNVRADRNTRLHTLWVSNDNDFLLQTADVPPVPNPNQFFVFGFTDEDLPGYDAPTHGLPFGN